MEQLEQFLVQLMAIGGALLLAFLFFLWISGSLAIWLGLKIVDEPRTFRSCLALSLLTVFITLVAGSFAGFATGEPAILNALGWLGSVFALWILFMVLEKIPAAKSLWGSIVTHVVGYGLVALAFLSLVFFLLGGNAYSEATDTPPRKTMSYWFSTHHQVQGGESSNQTGKG